MPRKKENTTQEKTVKKIQKLPTFYQAIGRRKNATARIRLFPVIKEKVAIGDLLLSADQMIVNGRPVKEYFPGQIFEKLYFEPFKATNTMGRFAATIKVEGSGLMGQLGAVVHGISRALCKIDTDTYRPLLKPHNLLTRDSRMKERRKAGLAGKARAAKQSPKR